MIILICFTIGACLGSFIPCFAERRQMQRSQKGRSVCLACNTTISPLYLIPIIGYFLSKGHCHHCGTPIPKSLIIYELLGGFTGILVALNATTLLHPLLQLIAIAILLLLSLDDWHTQYIRDCDLFLYSCILGIDIIYFNIFPLSERLIGALIVAAPLMLVHFRWPHALGSGDIIFMAISGFYLGITAITYAFLVGIFAALAYALWLMHQHNATMKTAIPLIPFLSFGVFFFILVHNQCIIFP